MQLNKTIAGHKNFKWSLVVASNSEEILNGNLLYGDEAAAADTFVLKGALSASAAYNCGLSESNDQIIVFAHQDIFLPPGWSEKFSYQIRLMNRTDPNWGVVGLYGVKNSGECAGFVYSTGLRRFVGEPFGGPTRVRTLDELLLVVRKSSGLRFDERLPGFHLYGTDICLEAEARGMKNYIIPCFALHNSVGVKWLPWNFWCAYMHLRKKWADRLPVATPCTRITRRCTPIVDYFITSFWAVLLNKKKPGTRVGDPGRFYKEHLAPTIERQAGCV